MLQNIYLMSCLTLYYEQENEVVVFLTVFLNIYSGHKYYSYTLKYMENASKYYVITIIQNSFFTDRENSYIPVECVNNGTAV